MDIDIELDRFPALTEHHRSVVKAMYAARMAGKLFYFSMSRGFGRRQVFKAYYHLLNISGTHESTSAS